MAAIDAGECPRCADVAQYGSPVAANLNFDDFFCKYQYDNDETPVFVCLASTFIQGNPRCPSLRPPERNRRPSRAGG